jgi:hypothetical protein
MLDNVPMTTDAGVWFERQIPFDDGWFSALLLVYEEIMLAFYFRRNRRRGNAPLCGFPYHPPAAAEKPIRGIAYPEPNTTEGVNSWQAAIEWWENKCSLCAGHGLGGQDIQHTVRQCTRGGIQALRSRLAEAMYQSRILPKYSCAIYHLPYDFCDDWTRVDGEWVTITTAEGVLCQFDRHLLIDTIIGFHQCGKLDFKLAFFQLTYNYCVKAGLAVTYDAETVAHALAQQITITGVVGSQLLRTLLVPTGKSLSGGEDRAGNKHASGR